MLDSLPPYIAENNTDTDIFCLQEATANMRDRCKELFIEYTEFTNDKSINERDVFNQTIYVKKNLEILESGALLQDTSDSGLATYIRIKSNDKQVYVCNVHGISRPGDKRDTPGRISQSKTIIDFFDNQDVPIIIGGDFNISPDTESIEMFSNEGYQDLIKDFDIDTTRNHYVWDRHPTKMYYSDYVFLSSSVIVNHFEVPKNEVSDHLPMILDMSV